MNASRTLPARHLRGFTLIELLIVVAIIAILSSIAIPAYQSYIARQKLNAGESDLVSLSMNMENYLQNNTQYPCAAGCPSVTAIQTPMPGWTPAASNDFSYQVTGVVNTSTPPTYTLQATGTSSLVSGCTITLTSANQRTLSGCPGGKTTW